MKRLVLILLVLPGISFAQETGPEPAPKIIYQKETEVIFGGVDVHATGSRPDLINVTESPRPVFIPMTSLRRDFNPEMEASVDDMK